jgi:hypothetical protein
MRSEAGEFLNHVPRGNLLVGIAYNGHSVRRYFFIGPYANGKVILPREKDQHEPELCIKIKSVPRSKQFVSVIKTSQNLML